MNNNSRVAFNTVIQYIQLILNVLIGLISVRLILNALGQVDYGIYDVVGGVVGLFAFITSSLSQASMRFLSIRVGEGDVNSIKQTFSTCLWLHVAMALCLVVILELAGLFIFNGFLNIPQDRMDAARVVFHFVALSLFFNVVEAPFQSIIGTFEDFWYTSVVSLIISVLKLVVALFLTICSKDKLIIYGFLLTIVTTIEFFLYWIFVKRKYDDFISFSSPNSKDVKSISGFVGWTLLDSFATISQRQGYAILINKFFGPIANTSYAVSKQVDNHVYMISSSVISTMKPQIMKSYGMGDESRTFRLSMTAGKFGFSLMSMVSIPLIVMLPDVLTLWLKSYPNDAVVFCRLLLTACMIEQLTRGLVFANQAVGNIKWFSIVVSIIRISALPLSWILFKAGCAPYMAFVVLVFCELLASYSRVIILSRISNYKAITFFTAVLLKVIPPVLFEVLICYYIYSVLPHSILVMLLIVFVSSIVYGILIYLIGLTKEEKNSLIDLFKQLKKRFHKA